MREDENDGKDENDGSQGKDSSHSSHYSHSSPIPPDAHPVLPPRGDYQTLLSFQKAEIVYDLTFRFAHKFLSKGDRTIDQMVQAARSGKKNILIDRQLRRLEKDFLEQGGLRERMTRVRLQARERQRNRSGDE
jgi:four helix bundle suffix protein